MELAIDEAKGTSAGELKTPYAALVVKDGSVLGREHNTVRESEDPTAHAEMNAIRSAARKLGSCNLEGCTLYTTVEPCSMCFSAAWWAGISRIVYGASLSDLQGGDQIEIGCGFLNDKTGSKIAVKGGVLRDKCIELLKNVD